MKRKTETQKNLIAVFVLMFITITAYTQKPTIEWINLPAGTFTMGSPKNEINRNVDETQHQVKLNAFKISKYEVTVNQFKAFVDATGYQTDADKGNVINGSFIWTGTKSGKKAGVNWKCDEKGNQRASSEYDHPVIHVSWNDVKAFADWMGCRLPTEAEWEYACRAGTSTPFNTGINLTSSQANYDGYFPYNNNEKGERRAKTLPIGSFPSNAWGLYDMHGNVSEWCSDWYGDFSVEAQTNPKGPSSGDFRVVRGGAWNDSAYVCRSAHRRSLFPPAFRHFSLGFRLVSPK